MSCITAMEYAALQRFPGSPDITGRPLPSILTWRIPIYPCSRQAEGISRAMAKGVQFGRPGVDLPDNFDEIFLRYKRKELTVSEAADMCNMARTTFYDRASRYEKSMKSK